MRQIYYHQFLNCIVAISPTYCNNLYVVAIFLVAKAYFSSSLDGIRLQHRDEEWQERRYQAHHQEGDEDDHFPQSLEVRGRASWHEERWRGFTSPLARATALAPTVNEVKSRLRRLLSLAL